MTLSVGVHHVSLVVRGASASWRETVGGTIHLKSLARFPLEGYRGLYSVDVLMERCSAQSIIAMRGGRSLHLFAYVSYLLQASKTQKKLEP